MRFLRNSFASKRIIAIAIIATMLLSSFAGVALAAKKAKAPALSGEIKILGSNTVFVLFQATGLDKVFMKKNKKVKIHLEGPGSSVGIKALMDGKVTLAMSSRALKHNEAAAGLKAIPIAHEALVMVVNKKNKVKALTTEQIKGIYLGKITNWKEVGGADAPIMPVARTSASGTYEYFRLTFLGEKETYAPVVKHYESHGLVQQAVVQNPNAVAYLALNAAKGVKFLTVDGKLANKANVKKGIYPVVRPLFLVTKGEPTGLSKAFIDWVLGKEGQKVVMKKYGAAVKK